jgi:aspartokinase
LSAETVHFEKERGVTEVEVTHGIVHILVRLVPEDCNAQRLAILQRFAEQNVPVFLVKLLPEGISFALREGQVETGTDLLTTVQAEMGFEYQINRNLGLVTTRAGAMRDLSGIMATIYEVMVTEGILVQQTGDAYNAVHCLLAGEQANHAAAMLRQRFAVGQSEKRG